MPIDYLTPLIGIATGTIIGVIAEPIRTRMFRPRLEVLFDPARHVTSTPTYLQAGDLPVGESRGHYVRVQIINRSSRLAKGCRVFLIGVEQMDDVGIFRATNYLDSLRLKWASQTGDDVLRPFDLPHGISQFVDVVTTDRSRPNAFSMQVPFVPGIYLDLFSSAPKTLRFTILATGDDVKPARARVVFKWTGVWDDFVASPG